MWSSRVTLFRVLINETNLGIQPYETDPLTQLSAYRELV